MQTLVIACFSGIRPAPLCSVRRLRPRTSPDRSINTAINVPYRQLDWIECQERLLLGSHDTNFLLAAIFQHFHQKSDQRCEAGQPGAEAAADGREA